MKWPTRIGWISIIGSSDVTIQKQFWDAVYQEKPNTWHITDLMESMIKETVMNEVAH